MNAAISANSDTLWFDVCGWDGWKPHDSGLHPSLPYFKYHVPVGSTTKWAYWLIAIAACEAANVENIGFTTGNLAFTGTNTEDLPNENSHVISGFTPKTTQESDLCLYGETYWCGSYYTDKDPSSGCDPTDPCKYEICFRTAMLEVNYAKHMSCLRTVCPPKYSTKYVECSTDMAAEQAQCLRDIDICSNQSIRSCYLEPKERFEWMQDCLQ